jgi:hypothetical protein
MSTLSSRTQKCNYYCPFCRTTGATPNMAGRFFIINETQCQCNACNSIFKKELIYSKPIDPSNLDGEWTSPLVALDHDNRSETTVPESVAQ